MEIRERVFSKRRKRPKRRASTGKQRKGLKEYHGQEGRGPYKRIEREKRKG